MSWKQEDADLLMEWSMFVGEHARFDVSAAEMIKAVGLMQRYNKLPQKVRDHIVELQRVIHPGTPEHPGVPGPEAAAPVKKPARTRKPKSD